VAKFFTTINARLTTNKNLQKSVQLTQKAETAVVEVDLLLRLTRLKGWPTL